MNPIIPVALFVYNRPEHAKKTIEALKNNSLSSFVHLYIFADGAKKIEHNEDVRKTRDIIKAITGFNKITIIERIENYGLQSAIISGVNEVLSDYDRVTVLEDDMITGKFFLDFSREALEIYKDVDKVISVHGSIYPIKQKLPETFFLIDPGCWGWSTWRRGWEIFEPDGKKLYNELEEKQLLNKFDFEGAYPFSQILKDQQEGKTSSWAIRWYASAFLKNKLTLYPGYTLIENIGSDGSGEHKADNKFFNTKIYNGRVNISKIELEVSSMAYNEYQKYLRRISGRETGIMNRILRKFKQLLT